jgi:hypothetical protein
MGRNNKQFTINPTSSTKRDTPPTRPGTPPKYSEQGRMSQGDSKQSADAVQPARPQLVAVPKKNSRFTRRVIGMNHDVKTSVKRIFYESNFDITNLLQVARIAGIRGPKGEPERKVREILCEAFFEQQQGPQPPSGPAAHAYPSYRRAA